MEAPSATLRPLQPPVSASSRAVSVVLAVALNVGIIAALVVGLGSEAVKLVIQNIDVAVIKEPPPDETKPPPPPPPQTREPPPFVPPPDINIDIGESTTTTTAITTQSQAPAPPAPPAPTSAPKALNSHAVTDRDYPPMSVRLNEEGRVTVRYLVDAEGNVADVQIVNGSGKQRLDAAAIPIVKRWRFKPALQEGKPVPMWQQAVVVFRLR
jgi:protein TonB